MRRFLTAGLLLGTLFPAGQAAVFTVKPDTAFYSKPQAKPEFLLPLPEVRVHVPALKDAAGFCWYELNYKIVDRENPELPAARLGPLRLNRPACSEPTPSCSASAIP